MLKFTQTHHFISTFYRVRNWALKFGVDLWEFGRQFTKMNEIKSVSNYVGDISEYSISILFDGCDNISICI